MTMPVRLVQPLKAEPPRLVSPEGRTTPSSNVQPLKAEPPMLVTEDGIEISVIFEFEAKLPGSTVTPSPMVTRSMFEVGIPPIDVQLRAFHVKSVIALQFRKVLYPTEVKCFPTIRVVNDIQPSNA